MFADLGNVSFNISCDFRGTIFDVAKLEAWSLLLAGCDGSWVLCASGPFDHLGRLLGLR